MNDRTLDISLTVNGARVQDRVEARKTWSTSCVKTSPSQAVTSDASMAYAAPAPCA